MSSDGLGFWNVGERRQNQSGDSRAKRKLHRNGESGSCKKWMDYKSNLIVCVSCSPFSTCSFTFHIMSPILASWEFSGVGRCRLMSTRYKCLWWTWPNVISVGPRSVGYKCSFPTFPANFSPLYLFLLQQFVQKETHWLFFYRELMTVGEEASPLPHFNSSHGGHFPFSSVLTWCYTHTKMNCTKHN